MNQQQSSVEAEANVPGVLNHEVVSSQGATRMAFVIHGALGSGQNFRGFVRKLCQANPDVSYVLVDLRAHGDSPSFAPPHTIENCARDLEALAAHLDASGECPPLRIVIGHSLGGKVAFEFARVTKRELEQVWLLDSDPGSQQSDLAHEIHAVMAGVRAVPQPIAARQDVVRSLRGGGLSAGLANWMTTNLRREGERYVWAFDLEAIDQLLHDYFHRDLWGFLAEARQSPIIHLVVADNSDRWTDEMRQRATGLPSASQTRLHLLPDAGHWLHVDNPQGLLDLMTSQL